VRGRIPEPPTPAAGRLPCRLAGQLGHQLLGAAQVLLRDDARLAIDAGGLDQLVVGLVPPTLPHVVGWLIAERASALPAENLLADTIIKQRIAYDTLTIQADNHRFNDLDSRRGAGSETSGQRPVIVLVDDTPRRLYLLENKRGVASWRTRL
jgi:hypothetical protein